MAQRRIYSVVVGNIGTVHTGRNLREATRIARDYERQSTRNEGRAAGESVCIMQDDGECQDIIREFHGSLNAD